MSFAIVPIGGSIQVTANGQALDFLRNVFPNAGLYAVLRDGDGLTVTPESVTVDPNDRAGDVLRTLFPGAGSYDVTIVLGGPAGPQISVKPKV